jgi:probable selenium-dependent hydroxylase accessory protein YqeC
MHETPLSLLDCFGITPEIRLIAVVGGGGKTSLMFALARELDGCGRRVITTTTTKIFTPSVEESPCLLMCEDGPEVPMLPERLATYGHVTVAQRVGGSAGKLGGVSEETLSICLACADHVIVEADGAAGHPIKAPEPWEPVIPSLTDLVVPVVGLDCLGKPVSEAVVFRLKRFLTVTGLHEGDPIDPEAVAAVMAHDQGGMKGVRENMRVAPFLNKLDALLHADGPEQVASAIFRKQPRIRRVVAGQLKPKIALRLFRFPDPVR